MKLTNSHKDAIVKITVDAVLQPRRDKLTVTENELANRAYEELYPPAIQKKMDALPADFFKQTSRIFVDVDRVNRHLDMKSSRRISARDNEWRRPVWSIGSGLFEVQEYFKADTQLQKDEATLRREIESLLAGITTVAKLQEVWPDGSEYYKWLTEDNSVKNPLMVRPDKVNELITTLSDTNAPKSDKK